MPVLAQYESQIGQPLPNGHVWAVLIHPVPASEENKIGSTTFHTVPVSLSHHAWTTSQASKRCGFALQLAQWQHRENVTQNTAVHGLFLECDDKKDNFATVPASVATSWSGDVVAIRADGKHLEELQVKSLLDYLFCCVGDFVTAIQQLHDLRFQRPDLDQKANKITDEHIDEVTGRIKNKLSPGAYQAYFTLWKDWHIEHGIEEIATIQSPVELTVGSKISKICDFCDATPEEGKSLGNCKTCKKAWYCGKECQKKAWRAGHKQECQKDGKEAQPGQSDSAT